MNNPWTAILHNQALCAVARLILMEKSLDSADERVDTLCAKLGLGATAVTNALNELAVEGFARRITVPGEGPGKPPRKIWSFSAFLLSSLPASQVSCDPPLQESTKGAATRESVDLLDADGSRGVSRAPAPVFGINTQYPEQEPPVVDQEKIPNKDSLGGGGVGEEPAPTLAKRVKRSYSDDFEMIWFEYGRRGSKPNAWAQWQKAIQREDQDVIMTALLAYIAATAGEPKYRKHLERWLRDDCWESDLPETKTQAEKQSEAKREMGNADRHLQQTIKELHAYTNATLLKKMGIPEMDAVKWRAELGIPEPEEDRPL